MNVRDVLPRDAIPSIDDPSFGPEYFGDPGDRVLAVESESTRPRAYPIRILHYHEIVNDDVGSPGDPDPIAVTWCPLCGSAVVYDRCVDDRVLTFGVSGKLADDDLVMYDRETGSEWKQSRGDAIAGELQGTQLTVGPAATTTWESFRAEHPDGLVLQRPDMESEAASDDDSPAPVDYDVTPYEEYFERDGFGLAAHRGSGERRDWDREDIDPKTVVLGVERDGEALGFPRPVVRSAGGVVQSTVGATDVVVFEGDGELHAFENPGFGFERNREEFAGDGTQWDGTTGRATDGRRLERVPARRLFAFTWQDDHGTDAFYGVSGTDR